jgi:triacylglycerol lipase
MDVVLVHGFLNRGGIFRSLMRHLRDAGHTPHAPTLAPIDGRGGLPALAEKLATFVRDGLPPDKPFALVGFSMGALVARIYLQHLGGCARVNLFFSIAGPHEGTFNACLYPSLGVCQMRRNSPLLRSLNADVECLRHLPIVSYWTPYDLMIRPISSAQWKLGEQVRIPVLLHSLLVFDRRLHTDLSQRLARI